MYNSQNWPNLSFEQFWYAKICSNSNFGPSKWHFWLSSKLFKTITLFVLIWNDFLLLVWSELKFLDEKSSTSVINFEVPSPLPKVNKNQERWSKVSKAKQKWFPSKYFCSDDASAERRCCCPLLILDGAKLRESKIHWKINFRNTNVK